MHHLISWTQYILFSFAALLLYYVTVCLKFYRKEILQAGFGKKKINPAPLVKERSLFGKNEPVSTTESNKNNLTSTVHEFVYELKALLQQLAVQKEEKNEMLNSVEKLINKYQTLKGSHFQTGLANLIAAETDTICGLRLSEDELISLWK